MQDEDLLRQNLAAEYWRTYREWRYVYGLEDPCIDELRAAVVVESEQESLATDQRRMLHELLQSIDADRVSVERAA